MLNKSLAVGIILLLLITCLTPIVIGNMHIDTSNSELRNQIAFACTDRYGSPEETYILKYMGSRCERTSEKVIVEPFETSMSMRSSELSNSSTSSVSGGPMNSPWPMKCHDTHHTGLSPYSTADNPFIVEWKFELADWVEGGLIIDNDGIIYFGDFDYYFYAVYPNGTLKWRTHLNGWIRSSPAIAEDGTIYVGTYGDYLFAINSDGTVKWSFCAGGSISSSPAIAEDGTIYFGTMRGADKGDIVAVNPNGTKKWIYETGYYTTSDPAIGDDGTIYIGSGDTYLYAMNPNGTLKWRFDTGGYVKSHPSIADDGTIYFESFDGYLYALFSNGTLKWKSKTSGSGCVAAVIAEDGTLYLAGSKLYAINPDGTDKWEFDLGDERYIGQSSPAIGADGTIYVGVTIHIDDGGEVIAVNPDGTERWRSGNICSEWIQSSPCIGSDGTVYIGSSDNLGAVIRGNIHAFGPLDPNAPDKPIISGNVSGKAGKEYEYMFSADDPNGDDVYFYIEWGDGEKEEWIGPYSSGEEITVSHTWADRDNYALQARAKDSHNLWGDWATLEVSMPKNKPYINTPFLQFLENHPYMFPLLRHLMGL